MLGSLLSFVHSTIDANDPKFLAVLKIKISAMEDQFKLLSAAQQKTLLEATNAGLHESYINKFFDDQISVSSSMTEQFVPVKALIKENNTDETNNDNACQNLQLKLPEIKLPSFSDNNENIFDYLNFKLLFSNTIKLYDYLPTTTTTTKFTMLKNYLKGRALSLIENLTLDEEVYKNAWKLLDQVFLDKEAVLW